MRRLERAGRAGRAARDHEALGVELQQHRLALDVAHAEGDVAGQALRGVAEVRDLGDALQHARARAGRAAPRGAGAPPAAAPVARVMATPSPTMPGTFSVPERRRRSWPPPCRMGCRRVPRFTYSAPMPLGPYSLWPERLSMSTPSSATSTGSEPTAWTASVWNSGALLVRDARELGDRLHRADDVVGEHDGGQPRVVAERLLVGVQVDHAVAVHRHEVDGPAQAVEGARGLHDGRVLDRAHDEVAGLEACEVAEQGEVVGLGAAGGEDDLLVAGAERGGDLGARLLDGRARLPPQPVQLGRVAVALA